MAKSSNAIDELDFREIGLWSAQLRMLVLLGVCIATIVLSYMFMLKSNFDALGSLKSQQNKLQTDFADSYSQAISLDTYKKQMLDLQKMLQDLLQKLPGRGEIPSLLEDISQQALLAGLEFELIKPEEPVDKGFYYEQPIKMVLIGKYHGFGNFITGLAKLPRIVTLHDFSIKKKDVNKLNSLLIMEIYAKTYWYVSKEKL
jgi:type IV pilus assembly protein PilO